MNPFENERKEIDEYSPAELEKLYGFDPRAYDNDFKEVEPMDDDEYMLFIAGVEPEDIEDKDDDPDDEPIQDPAVCDDGRCGPKYDDDFDVPEWPEWQEDDEIEEISTNESLTEDVLDEANPFKVIGKAVQKGFNKVTGKTEDLLSIFTNFYIVASDLNGGNIRFLDKNGNTSKTAVTFNSLDEAKAAAKNASNTAKCKAIVRGIANKTLNNTDIAGFSTKGDTTTAPLYVYVTGKETLDNTPKLIKSYANYRKQVGSNGNVDLQNGEGQQDQQQQGAGTNNAGQEQGQGQGAGEDTNTATNTQTPPAGNGAGEGQGQTGGAQTGTQGTGTADQGNGEGTSTSTETNKPETAAAQSANGSPVQINADAIHDALERALYATNKDKATQKVMFKELSPFLDSPEKLVALAVRQVLGAKGYPKEDITTVINALTTQFKGEAK